MTIKLSLQEQADLLLEQTTWYRQDVRQQQKWKRDAKKAYRFFSGDQLSDDDKHKLELELRPIVAFNMVKPNVLAVVGMQTANRTEIRYGAHEGAAPEEQMFADWANTLLKKSDDDCEAEIELSQAFTDATITGLGWTTRTIDYEEDPKGRMVKTSIDPMRKWYDASAKRHNLVDRKHDFTEVFLDKWDFEKRFPDFAKKGEVVKSLIATDGSSPWSVGGEEHEMFDTEVEHEEAQDPYKGDHSSPDGYERLKDKVRVIECNFWKLEDTYVVFRQAGDQIVQGEDWDAFSKTATVSGLQLMEVSEDATQPGQIDNPAVVYYKKALQRRHYKSIWTGAFLLHHDLNIDPTGFTEHAITGDLDRATGLFHGQVRSMIDPQEWSNKLFMQIMLVVMSNPKGGAWYKKGAFKNFEKAKQDYAQASPLMEVALKDGETFDNVIKERMPSPYPQGLHEIMTYAAGILPRVTGLNLELLGMAQKDQPGILEHLRQQAGMTILASLFDSLRAYHKLDGKTALYLMRHEIPLKRQFEIAGKTNAQLVQAVANLPPDLDHYMIMVDEAPFSPNRKFLVFKMLTDISTTNPELAAAILPAILDYTPLPQSAVEAIKQQMSQTAQAQQQAQQQMGQAQLGTLLAEIKEMIAKSNLLTAQAAAVQDKIGRDNIETPAKIEAMQAGSAADIASAKRHHVESIVAPVHAAADLIKAAKPEAKKEDK